ncbi:30S ribosomal protein S3 [Candidatus Nitrosocosmicus franklandus]|uniref:Small ribosomal subunit protein uS3 n=2 Tax=Candidatus Nitrosocosmicus franklandianus TaxID=1798806 RepID=A0A484IHK8_9ARCH|nr:30S ribosomal protein S3 [Candidatus Nitrosocosmicus franklandus]
MNAIKNVLKNNYRNSELDEFLKEELKDAGFGGADIQKSPLGTRLTLYVTRPGLVIGRKGSGIRDLTSKLEVKFGLSNPQISVVEVDVPELNPKIMCNRLAQLIERGTAFRRAALWTVNTVKNAGALGVEVTISGKLRSERAHFEKHSAGIIPKSGNMADKVVREGIANVLTKMGIMGIRLKIAIKDATPPEFELLSMHKEHATNDNEIDAKVVDKSSSTQEEETTGKNKPKEILENTGEINK